MTEKSADTYTTDNGTLTTSGDGGAQRTFDYCVVTNTITFQETTQASLPFTIEATK